MSAVTVQLRLFSNSGRAFENGVALAALPCAVIIYLKLVLLLQTESEKCFPGRQAGKYLKVNSVCFFEILLPSPRLFETGYNVKWIPTEMSQTLIM